MDHWTNEWTNEWTNGPNGVSGRMQVDRLFTRDTFSLNFEACLTQGVEYVLFIGCERLQNMDELRRVIVRVVCIDAPLDGPKPPPIRRRRRRRRTSPPCCLDDAASPCRIGAPSRVETSLNTAYLKANFNSILLTI